MIFFDPRVLWVESFFSRFTYIGRKHRGGAQFYLNLCLSQDLFLVDVSDIFIFFCSGKEGESEAPGGGGRIGFLLKIPRGGGGCFLEGEGPGGCLWRIGEFFGGGG